MAPVLQDIAGAQSWGLSSEQTLVIAWGGLAAVSTFLFITILIFLCSSCDRGKRAKHQNGDHENLMTAPSDKETHSHSVTSLGTEAPASSYRNGAVSTGDVSEDSTATCVPTYEDVQSSLPDLCDPQDFTGKSVRCPQTRELPQIPADTNLESVLSPGSPENDTPLYNEGAYEVLKDSSSHENIIEDSLYETVKELKDISSSASAEERNLTMNMPHASPTTTECRMEAAVEYASVDHNRKSRQSINTQSAASTPTYQDDDIPPPLPKKLLDENENVQSKEQQEEQEDQVGGASEDDKRQSHISYKSRDEDPCLTEDDISAMYSSVSRTGQSLRLQEDLSHYSYIQDVEISPTSCNGTYATVRDIDKSPNIIDLPASMEIINGIPNPEYEAISAISQREERTTALSSAGQGALQQGESDYESIGDLQQNGDYTKL